MYREVLFELVDGHAATPLFRALSHDRTASTRLQSLTIGAEIVAVLIDHAGSPQAVARVRDIIRSKPEPTVFRYDLLIDEERHVRFVATWSRPPSSQQGVSLEHILHDTVGPGGLLFGRVEDGVIAYKAAAPEGRGLVEFIARAEAAFAGRFKIKRIRTGPFRPGWEIDDARARVDPDEEALLAAALAAGYYDEPKRCGVRELGDALGVSKSVIARRLRTLERRALESLVQ